MVLQEGFADANAVCVGADVASITGGVETGEDGVDGTDHAGFFGEGVDGDMNVTLWGMVMEAPMQVGDLRRGRKALTSVESKRV